MSKELTSNKKIVIMLIMALHIFLAAFLLFQIQPIIAKIILPWFGGSSSVWTSCMLVYQFLLLLGYFSAHILSKCKVHHQLFIFFALLAISGLGLNIHPYDTWKTEDQSHPHIVIITLLLTHIAFPYITLSMTSPTIQVWFGKIFTDKTPYKLYAVSNFGSLLALVSYPFVVEPNLSQLEQTATWSALYIASICTGICCIFFVFKSSKEHSTRTEETVLIKRLDFSTEFLWFSLSACASALLLAITNFTSSDLASIPFIWVTPLALYLCTFIVCFGEPKAYSSARLLYLVLFAVSSAWLVRRGTSLIELMLLTPISLTTGCMICHGELAMRMPEVSRLTRYYLIISLGGAAGGFFVGIIAPHIFPHYFELELAFALVMILFYRKSIARFLSFREFKRADVRATLVVLAFLLVLSRSIFDELSDATGLDRNFYGPVTVKELVDSNTGETIRQMIHGSTLHGTQYQSEDRKYQATAYFGPTSGIGQTLQFLKPTNAHIGLVGLGVGSITSYAKKGDDFTIYEINPLVISMSREYFSYLDQTAADIKILEGDCRLVLERQKPQEYDIFILDAFSSDAVPMHLLTEEAFDLYLKHVKEGGILAIHISSRSFNLAPLFANYARNRGMEARLRVDEPKNSNGSVLSRWLLVYPKNSDILEEFPEGEDTFKKIDVADTKLVWTDDFSNIFPVLRPLF